MKPFQYLAAMLLLLFALGIDAQTINYSYDNSGNRILKQRIVLKSTDESSNAYESNALKDIAQESFEEKMDEYLIKIFPNPSQGQLIVNIDNFKEHEFSEITICDINGKSIYNKIALISNNLIDISYAPPGIYLLRIVLGNKISEWKVIKE